MDGDRADRIAGNVRCGRLFRDGRLLDAAQLHQPTVPAGVGQAQGLAIADHGLRRRVQPLRACDLLRADHTSLSARAAFVDTEPPGYLSIEPPENMGPEAAVGYILKQSNA